MANEDLKISQEDYQKYDLYSYRDDKHHGDVQDVINILCDAHKNEVDALHVMYRGLLDNLKHKLAREQHRATALDIAISLHNQKVMGNE